MRLTIFMSGVCPMDPKACLERLANAIRQSDWSTAVEALNNYYRWRMHGGFEPMVGTRPGDYHADELAADLADALGDEP